MASAAGGIELDDAGPSESVAGRELVVTTTAVDLDFFEVFQAPVLAGRGFAPHDTAVGANTVVVNQLFVAKILAGRNTVERRIRYQVGASQGIKESGPWFEIIGVVRDLVPDPEAPMSLDNPARPSPDTLSAKLLGATPTDWSRDGRWLVFYTNDPGSGRDLWVLPMGQRDAKAQSILATRFDESNAKFSPDGRWIAYQTNDSGRFEIAVRAFPSRGRAWPASSGGGVLARWSRDGNELYFVAPDGKLMAVPVDGRGAEFRAGAPVPLFSPAFTESAAVSPFTLQYDVARDGRFLINMTLDKVSATPITVILNWQDRAR